MKTFYLLFLINVVMLFTSCKDDSSEPIDLTGYWQSEEVYVNGELQADDVSKTIHFGLEGDNTYYRNYVSGSWFKTDNQLDLVPSEDLSVSPWRYKIIDSSDATLTLEIVLTEEDYGWDFELIADGEIITVIEKYKKK